VKLAPPTFASDEQYRTAQPQNNHISLTAALLAPLEHLKRINSGLAQHQARVIPNTAPTPTTAQYAVKVHSGSLALAQERPGKRARDAQDATETNWACQFCFVNSTESGKHRLVLLPCGHSFHQSSISEWLRS